MKPDWTMVILWALLGLCAVVVAALFVLPAFGLVVALVAWAAMALLIGIVVRGLVRAAALPR